MTTTEGVAKGKEAIVKAVARWTSEGREGRGDEHRRNDKKPEWSSHPTGSSGHKTEAKRESD